MFMARASEFRHDRISGSHEVMSEGLGVGRRCGKGVAEVSENEEQTRLWRQEEALRKLGFVLDLNAKKMEF